MVHSVLYYEFDHPIWSDTQWDKAAQELIQLTKDHPEEARAAVLDEEFWAFDGSTGMHFSRHPWGVEKAQKLLRDMEIRENQHDV